MEKFQGKTFKMSLLCNISQGTIFGEFLNVFEQGNFYLLLLFGQ